MPATTISALWSDFWLWIERHPAGAYLFRGQADSSPIIPKVGRPAYHFNLTREKTLFEAFERAARPFVRSPLSCFELLALAQHHGAPTRLVDHASRRELVRGELVS